MLKDHKQQLKVAERAARTKVSLQDAMQNSGFKERRFKKRPAPGSNPVVAPVNPMSAANPSASPDSELPAEHAVPVAPRQADVAAAAMVAKACADACADKLTKQGSGINNQAASSPVALPLIARKSSSSGGRGSDPGSADPSIVLQHAAVQQYNQPPAASPAATAPAGPSVLPPVSLQHQLLTTADVLDPRGIRELKLQASCRPCGSDGAQPLVQS